VDESPTAPAETDAWDRALPNLSACAYGAGSELFTTEGTGDTELASRSRPGQR